MYKKILVPLDGSSLAEAVLTHAGALAKSEHAELILLRVPITPAPEFFVRDPATASVIHREVENEAAVYVNAKAIDLKNDNVKVSVIIKEGPIPDTILEVAEEIHADVIAMSTHWRTGIQRWLMGSVADKIVHHAHVPVILVHPS